MYIYTHIHTYILGISFFTDAGLHKRDDFSQTPVAPGSAHLRAAGSGARALAREKPREQPSSRV